MRSKSFSNNCFEVLRFAFLVFVLAMIKLSSPIA